MVEKMFILPRPFTEADWASRTLGWSGEQGCESLPWLLLWHQRGDLTHCEAGRAPDDSPGGARSQPQALPECARGSAGRAEAEAGQPAEQDPVRNAHLLSLCACAGKTGPEHTCEQWVLRGGA